MARTGPFAFRWASTQPSHVVHCGTRQGAWRDLGFDALHLPDHLGAPAPFPVLTAIAVGGPPTVRLGTYVLNAGFYKTGPAGS